MITRRILEKLPPALVRPIVPFLQTIHDRAAVEIQRGCTQGCRFCQAGMIYRPTRERNLQRLTNNTRFLIPPWVQVPHLASHVPGLIARRVRADWQAKYGHPVHALETFVERSRFKGTCYRAANWLRLGQTSGRTRNDSSLSVQAAVKDVYFYPLVKNFREALCSPVRRRSEERTDQ